MKSLPTSRAGRFGARPGVFTLGGIAIAISLFGIEAGAVPVEWTTASGGNGHFYERVEQTGLTYGQAVTAAAARSFNGLPGHLVVFETPTYAAEFNFVDANVYAPGVTESRTYWAGAGWDGLGNNRGGWQWVDGSTVPTSITNGWNIDQFEGAGPEGISFFQSGSHTLWDYIQTNSSGFVNGFVVEYQTVPEPVGAMTLGGVASASFLMRRAGRRRLPHV
jgi:hypothetical protein